VEDEKIEQILECARLAPSWANKQCWNFVIVRDKEKIELISEAGGRVNSWLKKAPVIIVACGDPGLSGIRNGIEYFMVDVAIAMEHLILAAANLGLGSCWIGSFDENRTKRVLEIPNNMRVVAITPIGYPAEKAGVREIMTGIILRSKKRKHLNEIVHYDKW
jgi:nitroreductase